MRRSMERRIGSSTKKDATSRMTPIARIVPTVHMVAFDTERAPPARSLLQRGEGGRSEEGEGGRAGEGLRAAIERKRGKQRATLLKRGRPSSIARRSPTAWSASKKDSKSARLG